MTWTPDRPTKPGKYELSLHSDARAGLPVQMTAEVAPMPDWLRCDETDAGLIVRGDVDAGTWLIELSSSRLDRALWRPYVEPPDPFAEPVPKLVEQLPSDAELVKSAIRLMRTPRRRYSRTASQRPLWSRVMLLFGHGSTYSRAICRAHGFDPDEVWMIEETPQ